MRKVIGIFITMIIVAVMTTMAFGEAHVKNYNGCMVYDVDDSSIMDLIKEWANQNGFEKWLNTTPVINSDGWVYTYGGLDIRNYEEETGVDFTIQNYKRSVYELYDMKEFEITKIGQINGLDVWLLEGVSNKEITYGFNKMSIIGIMFYE